ncbi:uncharacterized protein LOC130623154 [Hydractinia symbiolongicarpus]|uniref:uncharacterized protein LOC130623154 n=1 Tax=Hydractinia symbiolongicarpus TaxID=13093 RepID=UPI00254FB8AE|nr:uncharacterized protein LOC130623154 [Hydractinia symbiolongicarpus]
MMDWLREYNLADVEPFIEAVDKTRLQYYDDEIDIFKDAVSIPGVSMRYVLNKSLRLNPKLELYAPREPCKHKCNKDCYQRSCKVCKKVQKACTECTKNEAYELLQTGMVGGPTIVFCRYHERDVTGIRSHIYGPNSKKCKTILGYDANILYPSTLMQDFPCGKEKLIKIKTPTAKHNLELLTQGVQKELYEKFSEMPPLFVLKEIPDDQIPEHMQEYLKATGRKRVSGTRKLLGLMKDKKILLYTPVLKWYLDHGLKVTAFHQFIKYTRDNPVAWFPKEIADARRQADKDPDKRIAGDTAKLKGNSFYGKMIEDLARHANTTFTRDEKKVDAAMRSPYLEDLEETGVAYEIRKGKKKVHIDRAYQCGIAVYQLAKLRMLEFYYDFIDKYVDRRDFEYIYMDTDSAYFAISGECLRDVGRTELLDEYDKDVKNWLVTDKYSSQTGEIFKLEFIGFRMIALTAKCYFVEGKKDTKFSCKGMSKKQNAMTWERYNNALNGSIDTAKNVGFRLRNQGMVTYEQNKLGLSAFYDKRKASRERSKCPHKKHRHGCSICDHPAYQYNLILNKIHKALMYDREISTEYLGCGICTFIGHIQDQFKDGMCCGNRGQWQFDHKVPLKYRENGEYPSEEVQLARLHYTNMQPLWTEDNQSKGDRYISGSNYSKIVGAGLDPGGRVGVREREHVLTGSGRLAPASPTLTSTTFCIEYKEQVHARPVKQDSTEKHLGYGEPKALSLTESKTLWVQTTTKTTKT